MSGTPPFTEIETDESETGGSDENALAEIREKLWYVMGGVLIGLLLALCVYAVVAF